MKLIWLALGGLSLGLGILGIPLPLLPTVPFLLLAAFFFAKSSSRLHFWLINHHRLGPPINNWNKSGVISRRAKLLASVSIALSFGLSAAANASTLVMIVQLGILICVSVFIWTRPE